MSYARCATASKTIHKYTVESTPGLRQLHLRGQSKYLEKGVKARAERLYIIGEMG